MGALAGVDTRAAAVTIAAKVLECVAVQGSDAGRRMSELAAGAAVACLTASWVDRRRHCHCRGDHEVHAGRGARAVCERRARRPTHTPFCGFLEQLYTRLGLFYCAFVLSPTEHLLGRGTTLQRRPHTTMYRRHVHIWDPDAMGEETPHRQ